MRLPGKQENTINWTRPTRPRFFYANRMVIKMDNLSVTLIGRQELIQNKLATGRTKDLADVETLKENEIGEDWITEQLISLIFAR